MKKLTLSILAMIILSGCTTYTNMNNDPKFNSVLSKQYQIQDDFVVLKYPSAKEFIAHKFGRQGVPSREEIKTEFPYQYESNTIHGVLPKGTKFKVIDVTFMQSFETSHTYYKAEILSDGPFKAKAIDVSLLTGRADVPQFLEKYAIEVTPEAVR